VQEVLRLLIILGYGNVILQAACQYPQLRILGVDYQEPLIAIVKQALGEWDKKNSNTGFAIQCDKITIAKV
jgi:tRNA G46 methylase TrmB